ncbi:hypothetical protein CO134_00090 [Candidatus Kuenenbacteria bacterium CG_4_9_14_3_um_filter_39_14]|uniref:Uncharacterized protein n=6 Tax=Candidatus Kueneniibacteriota TaxID=1752740 RepID=A0A2M7IL50_9BACT|nr:hypothetical protein [Candidatus Kuenenbacteria bacterium]OIP56444.1 MAG: hypothetical protein AUK13_01050 [Candidatus Kuenenbacteria bacterium CG2_30_39_24]PIP75968.1 MAG: hypothetical protein COW86_00725 [Candidatus Kuenenbacteria bacterium CG22_combo_CG10-13_8_21_14_all_39_9]PIR80931.1 MAG: hypothetical protein COU24_01300 [Candidatus Kuenenbacteria bacterium CG10_big_fil_rev_8_21_14_0_10_39_14]PIW95498.1 MAG: hypothetical protein COZ84_03150 [Candidatus Kuenenbacteria bacterium CG_4_8_14
MLDTSKDVLFYVSAISIIALTAFMCWLLYYFIAIVRNVYGLTRSLKKKMDLVEDILTSIKANVAHAANYIGIVVAGIDKIVNYVQQKKATDKSKKKS